MCYGRILERRPKHFDALHLLGVLKLQQGDATPPAQWITKALSLQPRASKRSEISAAH